MERIVYIGKNPHIINEIKNSNNAPELLIVKENALLAFDYITSTILLPTAIISEFEIPGINAYEMCKQVRNNEVFNAVVFMVVKDSLEKGESTQALRMGVDDVVSANFKFDSILPRLNLLSEYRSNLKNKTVSKSKKLKTNIGIAKRSFDIIVALFALVLLSPVLLITMVAIRLESKGAVFYAAKRVGSGYKIFNFYKFRSMSLGADKKLSSMKGMNQYANKTDHNELTIACPNCVPNGKNCSPILFVDGEEVCEKHHLRLKEAKKSGTFIKIKDDPRVTFIGKIIRNTSIDELPQLINVLKGDMSIVGNRPLPLYEAELLTSDLWAERFNAPAGITGLWQVEKRGSGSMSDQERKNLDNTYARNHSFVNDILLICKTVPALFQKENV